MTTTSLETTLPKMVRAPAAPAPPAEEAEEARRRPRTKLAVPVGSALVLGAVILALWSHLVIMVNGPLLAGFVSH